MLVSQINESQQKEQCQSTILYTLGLLARKATQSIVCLILHGWIKMINKIHHSINFKTFQFQSKSGNLQHTSKNSEFLNTIKRKLGQIQV